MPTRITATTPATRGFMSLNDQQINRIAALLDNNRDGLLGSDEVSLSLSARGRTAEPVVSTAALTVAMRGEKVGIRQMPAAVANDVAAVLFSGAVPGMPGSLDLNRDGQVAVAEVADALSKGRLVINRQVRLHSLPAGAEEHFRQNAVVPVGDIAQAMSDSQYHLIRGNGPAALAAVRTGLTAVAAAGGHEGLAAYAIAMGIRSLQQSSLYQAHPEWLTMIGRLGLEAISRGDRPQAVLAAAGRQVLYERPDEDGARLFFTAALQVLQAQLSDTEQGWETRLLEALEADPLALQILRQGLASFESLSN